MMKNRSATNQIADTPKITIPCRGRWPVTIRNRPNTAVPIGMSSRQLSASAKNTANQRMRPASKQSSAASTSGIATTCMWMSKNTAPCNGGYR